MLKKIIASIIGATGYTGIELLRLLLNHPRVKVSHLISQSHQGEKISKLWPHLKSVCDLPLEHFESEKIARDSDIIFFALPNHTSQKIIPELVGKTKIIDLSGDFRIKDKDIYEKFYGHAHEYSAGLEKFVYGFPELNKQKIAQAHNVANPGCFAITAQIALAPLRGIIKHASIFAITGSSGAGKTPKAETHHPLRAHNVASYRIGVHQHIPEIIQTLSIDESQLTLVPTSGPFVRGIHLTAFVDLSKNLDESAVEKLFTDIYANAPFVRIKKDIQLIDVIGSNFCDVSVRKINGQILIQAAIDNLIKGAGGNAVQNMNILFGLDETTGLAALAPSLL